MIQRSLLKKIKPLLIKLHIFEVLSFIYFAVARLKNKTLNHINKFLRKTAPVLLYHRIDKISKDPVMLTVTPETFEKHIKYINTYYKPVSLTELISRITTKSLVGDEVCVTFDDGYRDNLTNALPILEKYNTPATIFMTTANLGEQASFDWDMKYSDKDRANFLSHEEIKKLANSPLIEIGAHTHHHFRLSDLSRNDQLLEIETSKKILEDIIQKKVLHFAYPFGGKQDFNDISRIITIELGFMSACENTGMLLTSSADAYSFSRINIRECNVNYLSKQLFS